MREFVSVGIGGWLGAVSRYYLGLWIVSRYQTLFPLPTFVINITGCLILGFFGQLVLAKGPLIPTDLRLLVAVGFVGAYTTFSTFSLETVRLAQADHLALAMTYVLGSVAVGLLGIYLGILLARLA